MTSEYNEWLSKTEVFHEQISEVNAKRLHHTLTQNGNPPSSGEAVFPLYLLTLGEPSVPPNQLGVDGHPKRGSFMPPIPLKRRMFAGAEYEFHRALRVGDEVKTTWNITDITRKNRPPHSKELAHAAENSSPRTERGRGLIPSRSHLE